MVVALTASAAWRGRRPSHRGEVWTLAVVPGGGASDIVVSAGSDGRLRRWDAATGAELGAEMRGHQNKVWSLTVVGGADGDALLLSGSDDGTIRRWDPFTGASVGDPLVAGAAVRALTAVTGPSGPLVISGGSDGVLRRWNPTTGERLSEIAAPVGRIWALTTVPLVGRPTMVVVGGDLGLCLWADPGADGPLGAPCADQGGVRALAAGQGADGRAMVVSGGEDNSVRWWDPVSGGADNPLIGEPLGRHDSWVRALAVVSDGGQAAGLISGGDDWSIRSWDAVNGEAVGTPLELRSTITTLVTVQGPGGAVSVVSGGSDGQLRLWSAGSASGSPTRDQTVSAQDSPEVDDALGREVLATYLDQYLAEAVTTAPHGSSVIHLDGRWGAGKSSLLELVLHPERAGLALPPTRHLVEPIVVRYDAWRESAIAPEWWSLAVAVQRTLRGSLAWPVRWTLSLTDTAARLLRSRPVTFSGFALVLLVSAPWLLGRGTWTARTETWVDLLTAVAGVGTVLTTLGGALFWTAPVLGRLRLRSDDNPLEEIGIMVSRLRRWSPPVGVSQRPANMITAIGLATVVAMAAWRPWTEPWFSGSVFHWAFIAWWVVLLTATAGLGIRSLRRRKLPRRPILVLVDDLDRCEAERVVGLVETVHTLLRDDPRRGRTVSPAAMLVVMAADGRWVRQSFQDHYGAFSSLGDDTHSLGADFVQKVFDHTVLVPELTTDQSAELLRVITGNRNRERDAPRQVGPLASVRAGVVPRGEVDAPGVGARRTATPTGGTGATAFVQRTVERRAEAELEATASKQEQRAIDLEHRLTTPQWAALMPRNPRLIKRVANAWGMLRVVAVRRDGRPDDDLLVRAAILLVRFPSLVDELLTAIDATPFVRPAHESSWLRPDVQAIIAGVDPVDLALCYGHHLGPVTVLADGR